MTRTRRLGPWLEHRCGLRVRFCEVDAIQVAWHGHYVAWFEVGREAFGEAYGLGWRELRDAGLVAPVVQLSCDYLLPARAGDELVVVTRWHPSERAAIELSYEVRDAASDALLARGRTVQVFTDLAGNLLLTQPPLLAAFRAQWADQLTGG